MSHHPKRPTGTQDTGASKRARQLIDDETKLTANADIDPSFHAAGVDIPAESQGYVPLDAVKAENNGEEEEMEENGGVAAVVKGSPPERPSYELIRANPTDPEFFNEYLFALISFKVDHGNYSVHKDACPNLYAWMGHMKREYARFTHQPTTATLTAEQRKVLEFLHVPLTHRGDDHWNRFYNMLQSYKTRHGHVLVPRVCEVPGLGDWVTDQRRQFKSWKQGKSTQLTRDRREKLENLGFTWQVRYRPEWDQRYAELLEYKKKYGDCKVPQHYRENRALGKWVAKQREQYKLKKKGQHSFLTPDREEKLTSVAFVWQVRSSLPGEEEEDDQPNQQSNILPSPANTPTGPTPNVAHQTTETLKVESQAQPAATDPLAMRDIENVETL